jgi:anti-sigma B factor antagonist
MYPVLVSERDDGAVSIRVSGEIDALSCDDIELTILAATTCWPRVIVDLEDVTFCCSVGLGMFVRCEQAANERGVQLVLANPSRQLQRLVAVTGLTWLLAS